MSPYLALDVCIYVCLSPYLALDVRMHVHLSPNLALRCVYACMYVYV